MQRMIDCLWRHLGDRRRAGEYAFDKANCQFSQTRPLIPISFLKNPELGLSQERPECAAPVSNAVLVDDVVVCPENLKCRDGNQQRTPWRK
jgi:hypothetical protein